MLSFTVLEVRIIVGRAMSIWEAIVLGIVQGLTEFLPVSSSGHLELAKSILGVEAADDITFTIVVHGATVLSTIVVLWRELMRLLQGVFRFRWNQQMQYVMKLIVSMIPIAIVGFFFRKQVESLFVSNILLVGAMLLLTALLLYFASRVPMGKEGKQPSFLAALIMGVGQAVAVLPGLSRSGTTISMGILSGVSRAEAAKFSFLMVLPPIIGANLLDILDGELAASAVPGSALLAGFLAAFISGVLACRAMISLVQRRGLRGFALYCLVVGIIALGYALFF